MSPRARHAVAALWAALAVTVVPTSVTSVAPVRAAPTSERQETISGACDQPTVTDTRGDGVIDIVSVSLTSDCTKYQFTLRARRSFSLDDLNYWSIRIGPDPMSWCDQMATEITVRPTGGTFAVSEYKLLQLFDNPCGWGRAPRPIAVVDRPDSRSLRLTLTPRRHDAISPFGFTWYTFTRPFVGQVDVAPRFTAGVPPLGELDRVTAGAGDTPRSLRVSWTYDGPIDRFEVRWRRVGDPWQLQKVTPYNSSVTFFGVRAGRYDVWVRAIAWNRPGEWHKLRTRT